MYWTPDNSCYVVKHIYESVRVSFLKENGVGIRYKVKAELEEMPDNTSNARHEIYLYFADNRFCEQGFIDERYSHPSKEYVPITMDVFSGGDYELISFRLGDNCYVVEKTLKIEPRALYLDGVMGVWHKVIARLVGGNDDGETRGVAISWEVDRWFVYSSFGDGAE